jgi:hypothetical protein
MECYNDSVAGAGAFVNGKTVAAGALRAVSVTSPSGAVVNLGETMGAGKGVLIILRHLG